MNKNKAMFILGIATGIAMTLVKDMLLAVLSFAVAGLCIYMWINSIEETK